MFSAAAGTWPLPLAGDLEVVPGGGVFLVSRGFLTSGPDDPEGGFPPWKMDHRTLSPGCAISSPETKKKGTLGHM